MAVSTKEIEKILSKNAVEFDATNLSDLAKQHLHSVEFIDEQILQKHNELQVADSARVVYSAILRKDIKGSQT